MSELLYEQVETDLRGSVRDMLSSRSPVSRVLANIEKNHPYDASLWHTLATDMGLAGIAVPGNFGGGAASLREAGSCWRNSDGR